VQTATLANGMKVIIQEDHNIANVALYFFYKIGSRSERPGVTGTSHFFEHMMFNGANAQAVLRRLNEKGITSEQLAAAKAYLKGLYATRRLETIDRLAALSVISNCIASGVTKSTGISRASMLSLWIEPMRQSRGITKPAA